MVRVAEVVIERVLAGRLGDKQVQETVVVIVAPASAHPVGRRTGEDVFNLGEGAIPIVVKQAELTSQCPGRG